MRDVDVRDPRVPLLQRMPRTELAESPETLTSCGMSLTPRSVQDASDDEQRQGKVSNNKIPSQLRADFQQLRNLIKRDMKEVVQAELKRLEAFSSPRHEARRQHHQHHFADELLQVVEDTTRIEVASGEVEEKVQRTSLRRNPMSALDEVKQTTGFDMQKMKQRVRSDDRSLRVVQHIRTVCPNPSLRFVYDAIELALRLREPPRSGFLAAVVRSRAFEFIFTIVIILNVLFMVVQVNYGVHHPAEDFTPSMLTIDRLFLIAYSMEIVLKLIVHRLYFFWNVDMGWNILDLSLVGYSFFEQVLVQQTSSHDTKWMRMLRMFRVAKVLRVLRVVKSFEELQLIMNCILGSVMSMIWSVLMLTIAFYMFSLVLVQQTSAYLLDSAASADHDNLLRYFGAVEVAMWTLFKATFGGDDWSVFYHEVAKLGMLARGVWFLFVVFTQIALLNILTGIFVQSALQLAEGDAQQQALQKEESTMESAHELRKMCELHVTDDSGVLTKEQFTRLADSPEFSRYLRFIGLDLRNVEAFFELISDGGDGAAVSIQAFVAGCIALKGSAKSSDLMALLLEVKKVNQASAQANEEVLQCLRDIQDRLLGKSSSRRATKDLGTSM